MRKLLYYNLNRCPPIMKVIRVNYGKIRKSQGILIGKQKPLIMWLLGGHPNSNSKDGQVLIIQELIYFGPSHNITFSAFSTSQQVYKPHEREKKQSCHFLDIFHLDPKQSPSFISWCLEWSLNISRNLSHSQSMNIC